MAGIKYECNGYMVAHPTGHKRAGWLPFTLKKGPMWGRTIKGGK